MVIEGLAGRRGVGDWMFLRVMRGIGSVDEEAGLNGVKVLRSLHRCLVGFWDDACRLDSR